MSSHPLYLGDFTTETLGTLLSGPLPVVVLVPVGSVEPHGPHLPLRTDTIIGESAAQRAAEKLDKREIKALVGPSIPYGVTRFAEGFAGAISVPESALVGFLHAVVSGYLEAGFAHVCLVNNHLEPAHDAAVRQSIEGIVPGRASIASPLTRRHARTRGSRRAWTSAARVCAATKSPPAATTPASSTGRSRAA